MMNKKSDVPILDELKPLGCTNAKLRQLMRRVNHHYDLEMAKAGIKITQYSLLSYVFNLGPLRPGELAKSMKVSASTLTRNLKPLIDAGWIELSAGNDARSRSVALTAAGRVKRNEARARWKVAQDSLNQLLGNERVLTLHSLVQESLELLAVNDLADPDESTSEE